MIGVLLMAYGGPNSLDDVEPYYTHIRRGRPPSPELLEELKERYRAIGGASPLLRITGEQASALQQRLSEDGDFRVYIGMKHWHPYIRETVENLAKDGIRKIVALALAPHYSKMSIGGYLSAVREAVDQARDHLDIIEVESWSDHPLFIQAVAEKVEAGIERFPPFGREKVHVIFTAHSLPARILTGGDPYQDQLLDTARLVADRVGVSDYHFAYQSQGRTQDAWLGPTLEEMLDRLYEEGHRHVLVAPIGFVADHLEILYDLDIEAREAAQARGMVLERTESLNTSSRFIEALAAIVLEQIEEPI